MKIGIDIGGSHISVGIVNSENKVIAKEEIDIIENENENLTKKYIIDNIIKLIKELLKRMDAPSYIISEIGIATPGTVVNDEVYDIFNLGIKHFEIVKELKCIFTNAEFILKNDGKCAASAEKKVGSLKSYKNCIFLCLGTGIGGAAFRNDNMVDYINQIGIEYGHMKIHDDGIECRCGKKGCFEKYCSMNAFKNGLIDLLKLKEKINSKEILQILKRKIIEEDEKVDEYINNYIEDLAIGLKMIIDIQEPEAISLGGSFTYYEDILYKRLVDRLSEMKFDCMVPDILLAELKNDAGIVGSLL